MATQTKKSRTERSKSAAQPVLVGVDGSAQNRAAIAWAAAEAARASAPLKLLMVAEHLDASQPPYSSIPLPIQPVDNAYGVLDGRASGIRQQFPNLDIQTDVQVGDSRKTLVSAARRGARMVVVGKRGLGAIKRMMLGSTSIEVSGRAAAPVVVVPNRWKADADDKRSILVGIDLRKDSDDALGFAFERANELHVPLVALHVWDTHPSVVVTDDDRAAWGGEAKQAVAAAIAPWQRKYPRVEALAAQRHAHPAQGLLDAAEHAQLLVLGRHTTGRSPLGLGVGSVARTVLHHADVPVAVVPSS